ncbi:hypothetical protein FACS189472_08690 [Alphaproteobacteria bacterium]|nr:hypothetical protein FACS189472_08690 [Alphaproteobacteria bacterium]
MSKRRRQRPKVRGRNPDSSAEEEETIVNANPFLYPYVSKTKINKAKYNDEINQLFDEQVLKHEEFNKKYIPDVKMKPLKKFYRPSFSPHMNSWIIDIAFYKNTKPYLFIINENTRYLIVYALKSKSADDIYDGLEDFINMYTNRYIGETFVKNPIRNPIYIKGDGEKGFAAIEDYLDNDPYVKFYLRPPKSRASFRMTNSYNVIDAAIKTVRNLVGRASGQKPDAFSDENLLGNVIRIYNNTVHSTFLNKFTPAEMQESPELEALYIKHCRDKLEEVDFKRQQSGYLTYPPGAILLVHLNLGKTDYKFTKRRRNFDELGKFVRYERGNCVVDLLHNYPEFKRIIIPPFYTKFVALNLDDYRNKYNKDL